MLLRLLPLVIAAALAAACAAPPTGPAAAASDLTDKVLAVTEGHDLIRFKASAPQQVLSRVALLGLAQGEQVLGIDFRVSRGVLYAVSSLGRVYTVNTASGQLTVLPGSLQAAVPLHGQRFGVDFNPAADRIRVVSDTGLNLRLHPDTGAAVDGDSAKPGVQADADLHYAADDRSACCAPHLVAAGYTYNQKDDKLTTNFALDAAAGTLVMQGSREGVQPVVSPNTGRLRTVGALGVGFEDAAFDISDVRNTALAALRYRGATRLYRVDLASGRASLVGPVAEGGSLRGMAIEP
jgi:hypothetical protein